MTAPPSLAGYSTRDWFINSDTPQSVVQRPSAKRLDTGLLSGTSDRDAWRAPGNGCAAVRDSGTLSGLSVEVERRRRCGHRAFCGRWNPRANAPRHRQVFGVPRALPSVTSRRGHPPWRWPTRRGVTAAVLTKLMLTILSLVGGTAPPWPCSRWVAVNAPARSRDNTVLVQRDRLRGPAATTSPAACRPARSTRRAGTGIIGSPAG